MNEELERRVVEELARWPKLPESVIRMTLADELGCEEGEDQKRGGLPLTEDPDPDIRAIGYKVLDELDRIR